MYAEAGDDIVFGGVGTNLLHGGTGNDKATFDGNISDYNITYLNASVVVTNKNAQK